MSENAQTLYKQAIDYCGSQKWDQAIEAFSLALSSAENDPSPSFKASVYNGRGVAYAQKNKYDQAIADFSKALELQPAADQAVAYTNRGAARLERGDYDCAISDSDEALKLNPNQLGRAVARNIRGIAYTRKGDYDHAIADFNEALNLQPNRADVYYSLGYAHLLKKEHEKALEYLLKAGKHNPKLIAENTLCYIASKLAAASKVAAAQ